MDNLRHSRLTEADRADWAMFASRIRPLRGRSGLPPPASASAPPAVDTPPRPRPPLTRPSPLVAPRAVAIGDHPGGVDSGTWHRFRSGKLRAVRVIDLHGRTAQHAFQALVGFLRTAHADGARCVEVVTGRGSGTSGGVLRRELPLWLNLPEIRPMVLAAAHPHAANPGSVRLLLRRLR